MMQRRVTPVVSRISPSRHISQVPRDGRMDSGLSQLRQAMMKARMKQISAR